MELADDMLLKIVPFVFLAEKRDFCGGGPGGSGGKKGVPETGRGLGGSCVNKGNTGCGKTGKFVFSQT